MRPDAEKVELFSDDFSAYPLTERMDSAYFEQLTGESKVYAPGLRGIGPWELATLHYSWKSERFPSYRDVVLPWRLFEQDGRRWLDMPERFFNAVLAAGDPDWCDYVLDVDLAVAESAAGPLVRYCTSRQNYWACFEVGEPFRLLRRDQEDHVVLGTAHDLIVERDRVYSCRVRCEGRHISVAVDGRNVVSTEDDAYQRGKIALRTEAFGRFANVRVWTTPGEEALLRARAERRRTRCRTLQSRAPRPKLLKTVKIPPWTTSARLRDVNDDGELEVLCCEVAVPRFDYMRLARMTALDLEGNELWSIGSHAEGKYRVHGDFAFNTGDIDGDGRTEILVTRDFEILVLDGATGATKRKCATPQTYLGQEDAYERTNGDSFLICNLRGLETPQDFILKDRYRNMWAYTSDLQPLWHRHLNMGHYPRARDINGDGKDEVMAGYSMLQPDGHTMWTVPGSEPRYNTMEATEHVDAVLIERFGPGEDAPLRIALAASDFGFVLLDVEGNVLARRTVGHAQNMGAGRFRPDLPGRQLAVRTFWGNSGILNLLDCEGNPLLIREDSASGVLPVNWLGDGSALMKYAGHLVNGNLEPVVELPKGENASPIAFDFNGDGVDELFLRQGGEVAVYGPESVPREPVRFPKRDLANWNQYGGFYL